MRYLLLFALSACSVDTFGAGVGLLGTGGTAGVAGSVEAAAAGASGASAEAGAGAAGAADAAADTSTTCVTSLVDTGNGDFSISFSINTHADPYTAVLNQRAVCDGNSFWDISLAEDAKLDIEMGDAGVHYDQFFATIPVNDGISHRVVVVRKEGLLAATVDGVAAGSMPSAVFLGPLPPLVQGADVCPGDAPFVGSLSDVCLQRL